MKPETITALQAFIDDLVQVDGLPGIVLGITGKDEDISILTSGVSNLTTGAPMAPDSLFEIGSLSKSFTAISLLRLVEQGVLDMHQPVSEILPIFQVPVCGEPITIHHLLSHTAGITSGTDMRTDGQYEVYALRHTRPGCPPGVRYHYCNVGYRALSLLAEKLYQQPYAQIIREQFFEPLGMMASHPQITNNLRQAITPGYTDLYDDRPNLSGRPLVEAPWIESFTGEGSIVSTAGDMLKYIRMLLNEGRSGSHQILGKGGFDLLSQPVIKTRIPETWYGRGLMLPTGGNPGTLSHYGGMVGYSSYLLADRAAGFGLILLINYPANTIALGDRLYKGILQSEAGNHHLLTIRPEAVVDPQLAGSYHSPELGEVQINQRDKKLELVMDGAAYPLEPRGRNAYYCSHPQLGLYLVYPVMDGERCSGFTCGPHTFYASGTEVPTNPTVPAHWSGLCGHYRSHSPWFSSVRIILRGGRLLLVYPDGDEVDLVEIEPNVFREGLDELGPERVVFDAIEKGQALQLTIHGNRMVRSMPVA